MALQSTKQFTGIAENHVLRNILFVAQLQSLRISNYSPSSWQDSTLFPSVVNAPFARQKEARVGAVFPPSSFSILALDASQMVNTPSAFHLAPSSAVASRNRYHPEMASWCCLQPPTLLRYGASNTGASNKVASWPYSAIFRDQLCATLSENKCDN